MSADGSAPTPPPAPVLRVQVDAELRDAIKAACARTGETPEAFALRAMRRELETREAARRFAEVVGIDLRPRTELPEGRNPGSPFVSPSSGAPALPDVPDLLESAPTP